MRCTRRRHAVAIFGKSEAEIDHIVATRQVETALVVKSPIAGRITARNAAPGLLVQPGNAPAPYSVADLSTVWMLADVPESEIPSFKVGQKVSVSVGAFPGGYSSGDHGYWCDGRSEFAPRHSALRDQGPEARAAADMFATFVIRTARAACARPRCR